MNWRSAHRTIEKMTWKNHQRVHVSLSFTQITLNKPLLSYGFWRREIIEAMPTIWPYCIFLHAKSPSFSSNGWNTFKKVITVPHEVHVFYSSGLAHYTNMYTMREHFLLRLRAVYIYQPLYFFFYFFFRERSSPGHIQLFHRHSPFFLLNRQERNHPVKIYKVNFLVLTMVDCK